MKQTLKDLKQLLEMYELEPNEPTWTAIKEWLEVYIKELELTEPIEWCFDKGYPIRYATAIEEFKNEMLGENNK